MSTQSHMIKRQVFELDVPRVELARRLQGDASRMHALLIAPVLERVCSEVSSADRIHRIDKVDVDLGALSADDFEKELCEKLAPALRVALRAKILAEERGDRASGQGARVASALELFACFARTGSLPWWADPSLSGLLEENVRMLLREAPRELADLARELVREAASVRRIAAVYDDVVLADLCALFAEGRNLSAVAALPRALARAVESGRLDMGRTAARSRSAAWQCVLRAMARPRGGGDTLAGLDDATDVALCKEVLAEVAGATRVTYGELLSVLREAGDASVVPPLLGELLERLHEPQRALVQRAARSSREAPDLAWTEVVDLMQSLAELSPAGRRSRWRALLRALDPSLESEAAFRLPAGGGSEPSAAVAPEEVALRAAGWPAVRGLLERAVSAGRVSAELLERCMADLVDMRELQGIARVSIEMRAALAGVLREAVARSQPEGRRPIDAPVIDSRSSGPDGLFIKDSGVVLLWPFLARFFENLGLVEEGRFKDVSAQHRAVVILYYVASGEPVLAEYQLALGKVVCGLDVTEVLEPDEPISEAEAEECAHLLTAVITNAPALEEMSIAAFQASFLQRSGALTAEDGAWLLRVERETYDLVLARFPWSFDWVALPWMEAPMRVEWQ